MLLEMSARRQALLTCFPTLRSGFPWECAKAEKTAAVYRRR
jgi:hypothetical protein